MMTWPDEVLPEAVRNAFSLYCICLLCNKAPFRDYKSPVTLYGLCLEGICVPWKPQPPLEDPLQLSTSTSSVVWHSETLTDVGAAAFVLTSLRRIAFQSALMPEVIINLTHQHYTFSSNKYTPPFSAFSLWDLPHLIIGQSCSIGRKLPITTMSGKFPFEAVYGPCPVISLWCSLKYHW